MSYLGQALFYLCSLLTLAGGLGTVLSRNAIRAAMSLLVTILGIAGLYLALSAQLLAAVQLIVYAGAVVVLFVFVIMMLGPSGGALHDKRTYKTRAAGVAMIAAGTLAAFGLVWKAAAMLNRSDISTLAKKPLHEGAYFPHFFDPPRPELGTVEGLGRVLFSDGLIAFELSGLLLLVAIVGVMAIARTRHAEAAAPAPSSTEHRISPTEGSS